MIARMKKIYARYDAAHASLVRLVRFIISGGTGAFVDLSFLYIFTSIFHIWYVISTAAAFIIAFGVSFVLQKYWTFRDHSNDQLHKQASLYFIVAVANLFLNTYLVYFFVQSFHIHYIVSQIIASIIIAFESFFIYRYLFKSAANRSPGVASDQARSVGRRVVKKADPILAPLVRTGFFAWIRAEKTLILWVFAMAIALRLILFLVVFQAHHQDISQMIGSLPSGLSERAAHDAGIGGDCYFETSYNVIAGRGFSCEYLPPYTQYQYGVPLYPLFLIFILLIMHSYLAVVLIQILIGAMTPVFGMYLAKILIPGNKAPPIVGLILIFEPSHLLITLGMSPEIVFMPLFFLFLILFTDYLRRHSLRSLAWSACLLGLATLAKPTTEYLPVVCIIFVLWNERRAFTRKLIGELCFFFAIFLLMLSPWLYGNYRQFGVISLSTQPVRAMYVALLPSVISLQQGISFDQAQAPLLAQHPNNFTFANSVGMVRYTLSQMLRYPVGDVKMALLSSATFFTGDGVSTVLEDAGAQPQDRLAGPATTLLFSRPALLFETIWSYVGSSFCLVIIARLIFILLFILFLAGLYYLYSQNKKSLVVLNFAVLIILYFMLTTWSNGLSVTARFRMPVEPLIFAIAFAGWLYVQGRIRSYRTTGRLNMFCTRLG